MAIAAPDGWIFEDLFAMSWVALAFNQFANRRERFGVLRLRQRQQFGCFFFDLGPRRKIQFRTRKQLHIGGQFSISGQGEEKLPSFLRLRQGSNGGSSRR